MNQIVKTMLEKYNKKCTKLETLKTKQEELNKKIKSLEIEIGEEKLKIIDKASSKMSLEDIINILQPEDMNNDSNNEETINESMFDTTEFGEVNYENNVNL